MIKKLFVLVLLIAFLAAKVGLISLPPLSTIYTFFNKLGIFILFFILFAIYTGILQKFTFIQSRELLNNKYFLNTQLTMLITIFGFFGIVYLFSGFFELGILILILMGSQIGILASCVLRFFTGSPDTKWGARSIWANYEFAANHSIIFLLIILIVVVIQLLNLIYFGKAYFKLPNSSAELTIQVFRYSLIAIIFSPYAITIPSLISSIASSNLDTVTRKYIIIDQISRLTFIALFLALAFWAFDMGGDEGYPLIIGNINFVLSPILVIAIITFFIIIILIPCIVGAKRSKERNLYINNMKSNYLSRLNRVLGNPTTNNLNELKNDVNAEIMNVFINNKAIQFLLNYNKEENVIGGYSNPAFLKQYSMGYSDIFIQAFLISSQLDPRIRYVNWLHELNDDLDSFIMNDQINQENIKLLQGTIPIRKMELDTETKNIKEESIFGTFGVVGLSLAGLVPTILGILVSQLGEYAWYLIKISILGN